ASACGELECLSATQRTTRKHRPASRRSGRGLRSLVGRKAATSELTIGLHPPAPMRRRFTRKSWSPCDPTCSSPCRRHVTGDSHGQSKEARRGTQEEFETQHGKGQACAQVGGKARNAEKSEVQ